MALAVSFTFGATFVLGFSGPAVSHVNSRSGTVSMGGLTGLPRIPPKALQLTKKFNRALSLFWVTALPTICLTHPP